MMDFQSMYDVRAYDERKTVHMNITKNAFRMALGKRLPTISGSVTVDGLTDEVHVGSDDDDEDVVTGTSAGVAPARAHQ